MQAWRAHQGASCWKLRTIEGVLKQILPIPMEVPLIENGNDFGDKLSTSQVLPSIGHMNPCIKRSIGSSQAKNTLAVDDGTCYVPLNTGGIARQDNSNEILNDNCQKLKWSESDQLRLQSVEHLCTQSRKQATGVQSKIFSLTEASMDSLYTRGEKLHTSINLIGFYGDGKSGYANYRGEGYVSEIDNLDCDTGEDEVGTITSVNSRNLLHSLKRCKQNPGHGQGFLWIRVHDISSLTDIASVFDLDEICIASFKNLRTQSEFFLTHDGFFLSICSFHLSQNLAERDGIDFERGAFGKNQCSMRKLFIFVTDKIVLSYEVELTSQVNGTIAVVNQQPTDFILADAEINRGAYRKSGKGYLIAKLLGKSLSIQDSLFESCHDGLSYYSQQVRSLHTNNMKMRGAGSTGFSSHEEVSVRVLEIENCILLLQSHLSEVVSVISESCNKAAVNNTSEGSEIKRFLLVARGSAYYAASNLQQGLLAASHLRKTLKAIVQMRERRMGVSHDTVASCIFENI